MKENSELRTPNSEGPEMPEPFPPCEEKPLPASDTRRRRGGICGQPAVAYRQSGKLLCQAHTDEYEAKYPGVKLRRLDMPRVDERVTEAIRSGTAKPGERPEPTEMAMSPVTV